MNEEGGALQALGRRAWLIGLCTVVAAGSALGWSLLQEKEYSATAEVLADSIGRKGLPTWRVSANNVQLMSQDAVAERTARALGSGVTTAGQVSGSVEVEGGGDDSDQVTVTATDSDPRFAAELANRYAESSLQAVEPNDAEILASAGVPTSPNSPKIATNTVVGAMLGFLLGAALALLLARFDRRIKDAAELDEALGPVIGTVPNSKALATFTLGKNSSNGPSARLPFLEAEAFRLLGTRLRYFNSGRDIRSVVVTSALPGEGKTTIAANLAMTEAATGSSVLLLEADLRKPVLERAAGVHRLPGLAEVLTGHSALGEAVQRIGEPSHQESGNNHLDVIVGGAALPNPLELMESRKMATLVDELKNRYDLVVVDSPALLVLADAIPLIELADGVLVVAELGKITTDDAARLREELRSLDAQVVGVVANRAPKGPEHGYSYHYLSDQVGARARFGRRGVREPSGDGSRHQESPTVSPTPGRSGERPKGRELRSD